MTSDKFDLQELDVIAGKIFRYCKTASKEQREHIALWAGNVQLICKDVFKEREQIALWPDKVLQEYIDLQGILACNASGVTEDHLYSRERIPQDRTSVIFARSEDELSKKISIPVRSIRRNAEKHIRETHEFILHLDDHDPKYYWLHSDDLTHLHATRKPGRPRNKPK